LADFEFEVKDDGTVDFDEAFDGFVTGRGESRLTVRGLPVRLDVTALDHALLPQLAGASPLPTDRTLYLSLLPASSYGFQSGAGVVADVQYGVSRDGDVILDAQFSGFAKTEGNTLTIRGYPMVLDAAAADSDLVGIVQLIVRPQAPRKLIADLIPAKGYLPQTVNGVFRTAFNIERDGRITFDPSAAGRYVVKTSSSPNPSRVGQEVTISVYVSPVEPVGNTPQGTVSLRVGTNLFGSTTLDTSGEATLRTADLPRGEHDISVDYAGSPFFEPSSVTVHHRVE
jgi:Bacterial Ig-like domain (group 3)